MWVIYVGALTGILVLFLGQPQYKSGCQCGCTRIRAYLFPAGSMALHLFPKTD